MLSIDDLIHKYLLYNMRWLRISYIILNLLYINRVYEIVVYDYLCVANWRTYLFTTFCRLSLHPSCPTFNSSQFYSINY